MESEKRFAIDNIASMVLPSQGVVIPIGAIVTAATGVKKQSRGQEAVKGSRAVFGVSQAVKDNFQTW